MRTRSVLNLNMLTALVLAGAIVGCTGSAPTRAQSGWPDIPASSLIPPRVTTTRTVALPTSPPVRRPDEPRLGASTAGQASQDFDNETVNFLNARYGWITAQGSISVTTDGGARWTTHLLPDTTLLNLSFVSPRQGWAVGTTVSCGRYWYTPSVTTLPGFARDQSCPMRILHTGSAGAAWSVQFASSCTSVDCPEPAIHFANRLDGWALIPCAAGFNGHCAEVLHTVDAGGTWQRVELPPGFRAVDVTALGATAWISGARCSASVAQGRLCPTELLRTTDNGLAWTPIMAARTTTTPPQPTSLGGGHLAFINAAVGWLSSTALLTTTDGGKTWTAIKTRQPSGGVWPRTIDLLNRTTAVAAASLAASGERPPLGGIAITRDGGRVWTSVEGGMSWSIESIAAPTPSDLWAVGIQTASTGSAPGPTTPFLVHSVDGGAQWTQVAPAVHPENGIDFLSRSSGFGIATATDPMAVLVTHDGGRTWTVRNSRAAATGTVVTNLSFANAQDGWIAGSRRTGGIVLRATTDGGRTWRTVRLIHFGLGASPAIAALHLFRPGDGTMVVDRLTLGKGESAVTQSTNNNGRTWTATAGVPIGGFTSLSSLAYCGTHESWAITSTAGEQEVDDVKLLTSAATAGKWRVVFSRLDEGATLETADPVTNASGWIETSELFRTALLHTTNGGETWTQIELPGFAYSQIDFISNRTGWLLTSNHLWVTTAGGMIWQQMY